MAVMRIERHQYGIIPIFAFRDVPEVVPTGHWQRTLPMAQTNWLSPDDSTGRARNWLDWTCKQVGKIDSGETQAR
jgi:hypothetical protein